MTDAIRPPVGSTVGRPDTPSMSPASQEVNTFHDNSDVDGSIKSQHHTLGYGSTQAAAGDHTHDGANSSVIFADELVDPYGAPIYVPDGLMHDSRTGTTLTNLAATGERMVHFTPKMWVQKNHCYLVMAQVHIRVNTGSTVAFGKFRYNQSLMSSPISIPPIPANPNTLSTELDPDEQILFGVAGDVRTYSFHKMYTAPNPGYVKFGLTLSVNGTGSCDYRTIHLTVIDVGRPHETFEGGLRSFMNALLARLRGMGTTYKLGGDYAP